MQKRRHLQQLTAALLEWWFASDIIVTFSFMMIPSTGEILSIRYYHRFIIEIEFSWVEQIQLRVKGAL